MFKSLGKWITLDEPLELAGKLQTAGKPRERIAAAKFIVFMDR